MNKDTYGIELILDMYDCDVSKFTKKHLSQYFIELCELIKMKRFGEPMYWHDERKIAHIKGISGVQFIETSNIVIHCMEMMKLVLVNIFSCKDFDAKTAENFTKEFFGAKRLTSRVVERKSS